jgi:hypothetical protein
LHLVGYTWKNTFFPLNMFSSVLNIFVHRLCINALPFSLFPQQYIPLKEIFQTTWKLHFHTWCEPGLFMLVTNQISYLCWNRCFLVQRWYTSSLNLIIFCSASSIDTYWRICTYWASIPYVTHAYVNSQLWYIVMNFFF